LRHTGENISLAGGCAAGRAISDRLADAGPPSRHAAGRADDSPRLPWPHDPGPDRAASGLAANPSGGAGKLAAALAAAELGARALDALCHGAGDDLQRLAVRLLPRLDRLVLLSVPATDAGLRQCSGRQGDRRAAPGGRMAAASPDRDPFRR